AFVATFARAPMEQNGASLHVSLIGDNLGVQGTDLGQIGRVIYTVEQRGERLGLVGDQAIKGQTCIMGGEQAGLGTYSGSLNEQIRGGRVVQAPIGADLDSLGELPGRVR
ncbi:unnamed protein product, partial [Ilex paraguariensis]